MKSSWVPPSQPQICPPVGFPLPSPREGTPGCGKEMACFSSLQGEGATTELNASFLKKKKKKQKNSKFLSWEIILDCPNPKSRTLASIKSLQQHRIHSQKNLKAIEQSGEEKIEQGQQPAQPPRPNPQRALASSSFSWRCPGEEASRALAYLPCAQASYPGSAVSGEQAFLVQQINK